MRVRVPQTVQRSFNRPPLGMIDPGMVEMGGTIPVSDLQSNLEAGIAYRDALLAQYDAAGGGITADQLAKIISGGAGTALQIFKATQNPSLIPGTNTIYDPATGRILSSTGVNIGSGGLSANLGFGSTGTLVAIGGVVVIVAVLVMVLKR